MSTHSIHHVTAVTADIVANRRFYTDVLGLRLVKRSVNQDDVSAYHLFYADAVGSPGTDMTFFDWPNSGQTSPGAGTVALTSFGAPTASLDFWEGRLTDAGCFPERGEDPFGYECIHFSDPEGQRLEIVGTDEPFVSQPWTTHVPEDAALRGIVGVDLESARPDGTRAVLMELLGYQVSHRSGAVLETRGDGRYGRLRVFGSPARRLGRVGAGGVHHVAFRVADREELERLMGIVEGAGLQTSGVIDRYYFQSVYFREPGGVLFELATDGPGFASDEPQESLGERLALPPFLEPRRAEIEAGLRPLD